MIPKKEKKKKRAYNIQYTLLHLYTTTIYFKFNKHADIQELDE